MFDKGNIALDPTVFYAIKTNVLRPSVARALANTVNCMWERSLWMRNYLHTNVD